MLSSIRTPRMGGRDRQPEPWALEAKEFLRWVRGAAQCLGGMRTPCSCLPRLAAPLPGN